jgi:hypothetical protein
MVVVGGGGGGAGVLPSPPHAASNIREHARIVRDDENSGSDFISVTPLLNHQLAINAHSTCLIIWLDN